MFANMLNSGTMATALLALLSVLSQTVSASPIEPGFIEVRTPEADAEAAANPLLVARASGYSAVINSKIIGSCRWDWTSAHSVINVRCSVQDKSCDSHSVYALLRLYGNNAATVVEKDLGRFENSSGCSGPSKTDPTLHSWNSLPRGNEFKARVRACIDVQLGADTCYDGNLVDNPYA